MRVEDERNISVGFQDLYIVFFQVVINNSHLSNINI